MLLLKLIVVPALIGLVSLAGRRWGPGVSGLLVGLPWTSGPVLVFLALERGDGFASEAAVGIIGGVLSLVGFCLAYAWSAMRFGWATCAVAGVGTYLAVTFGILGVDVPMTVSFALVATAVVLAMKAMPRAVALSEPSRAAPWDIPLRMACATLIVVGLTSLAGLLGPRLAGLLAPFPVYASILAVFAQRDAGAWAALETLRGVIRGSFSFALFFLVAGIGLETLGAASAFFVASVSALALHVVLLEGYRLGDVRPPSTRDAEQPGNGDGRDRIYSVSSR